MPSENGGGLGLCLLYLVFSLSSFHIAQIRAAQIRAAQIGIA
jgi:hypothetical protein